MNVAQALAEDLRRFALILLAAGVVGGFLQDQVSMGASIYAAAFGIALGFMGYWLHNRDNRSNRENTT